VRRFKQIWSDEKSNLPLEKKVIQIIDAHASTISIYREF